MASIFSLFGEVLIDNTNANKAIDTTTEKAENSGSKVGSAFKGIAKGAVAVGTAVVGAATTLGAGALKMATDTSNAADEIDKMSQKVGLSRTAYQEWDYVLSQNGMDISSLQTGVKSLTAQMDKAASGSGDAADMFKQLGVEVTNADGSLRSQEDVFNDTIAALQGVDNETERARLATKLFGKAGTEMAPLLNQSADSVQALKDKAHELGMVMSDETIDAGVKFTDTMDTLKRSFGGIMTQLGGAVIPIVQKFADLIQEKMPQIQAFIQRLTPILESVFDNVLPPLFDLIESLLPILFDLLESLLPVFEQIITAVLPVIVQLIQELLPFFVQIIQEVLPIAVELLNGIMPLILQIVETVLPVVVQLLQAILPPVLEIVQAVLPVFLEILNLLLPPLLQVVQAVLPVAVQFINAILPIVVQIVQAVLPVLLQIINALLPIFQQFCDLILPLLLQLFEAVMPILTKLADSLLPLISSLLDALLPILSPILELLSTILEPLFSLLEMILPPLCDFISMLIDNLLPPLEAAFSGVAELLSGAFSSAFETVSGIFESLGEIFGGVIDFITGVFSGNWEQAWDGIVSIFKGIFNLIPTIVEGVINGAIGIINGIIWGINQLTGTIGIPEIPSIPNVELPRLRIGLDYVPYDEFPALLHKGERVLTAGESEEYEEYTARNQTKPSVAGRVDNSDGSVTIIIQLGERSIVIENLNGKDPDELDAFVDEILEMIAEKIKRKGVIFE